MKRLFLIGIESKKTVHRTLKYRLNIGNLNLRNSEKLPVPSLLFFGKFPDSAPYICNLQTKGETWDRTDFEMGSVQVVQSTVNGL